MTISTEIPHNLSKKDKDKALIIRGRTENIEKTTAQAMLSPSVQAATAIQSHDNNLNVNALVDELSSQIEQVHDNDLKRIEAMLIAQAHTLDALFGNYVRRAGQTKSSEQLKTYINIGFKAQSQCRMTVEALSEIKNPKPYIQNNKAQYQQVNNGNMPSRARGKNSESTNELLEDKSHEWMDTRAAETPSRNDKEVETVGTKHGAKE